MEVGQDREELEDFRRNLLSVLEAGASLSRDRLMHTTAIFSATRLLLKQFGREALEDRTALVGQVKFLYTLDGVNETTRRHLALAWAHEHLPVGEPSEETMKLFQQFIEVFALDHEALPRFIDSMVMKFHPEG